MLASVIVRLRVFRLTAEGFEHDVKVTGGAESRAERLMLELTRTEVVEHGTLPVQERLDVEELERPAFFPEDALAECKTSRLDCVCMFRTRQVVFSGGTEHARLASGLEPARVAFLRRFVGAFRKTWLIEMDQDFAQLDASMRLDHDGLTTVKRACRRRIGAESRNVSHGSVANQIGQLSSVLFHWV
jgi:hypothetical protein